MRRAAIATAILALALAGCTSPSGREAPATATAATVRTHAAATVSPACRAWIAGELQDSIDADSGHAACGDLTDAELGQAVDDVLAELVASKAAQ